MGFWTSLGVTWSIQGRQGDGFIFAVSASVWVGSKFPGCNFGAGCGSQGPGSWTSPGASPGLLPVVIWALERCGAST